MVGEHQISQRQACKVVSLPQSTTWYKPVPNNDDEVINELRSLIEKPPSIVFWQSNFRSRRMGYAWNHKPVYRFYTELELNIHGRFRKRLPARVKQALYQPDSVNKVWSVDVMSDTLCDVRRIRLLNIVDDYNREVIHI